MKEYDLPSLKLYSQLESKKYRWKDYVDKYGNTMRISFNKQRKEYSMNLSYYTENTSYIVFTNKLIYKKLDLIFNKH